MVDVLTLKGFYTDCPFKSIRDQQSFRFWLCLVHFLTPRYEKDKSLLPDFLKFKYLVEIETEFKNILSV